MEQKYKIFHASASQRSKGNQVNKILDKDGRLCTTHGAIEEAFLNYFQDLFKAGENLNVEDSI
jgi:hypothetical protein